MQKSFKVTQNTQASCKGSLSGLAGRLIDGLEHMYKDTFFHIMAKLDILTTPKLSWDHRPSSTLLILLTHLHTQWNFGHYEGNRIKPYKVFEY